MWTPPPPPPQKKKKKKPQELKHYSSYLPLSTTIQHLATPLQLSLSWSYSAESKLIFAPKLAWPIWRAFCTQTGSRYGSVFTGWYISADKWALGSPWLELYFIHLTLRPGGWTHMKRVGMLVVYRVTSQLSSVLISLGQKYFRHYFRISDKHYLVVMIKLA